MDTIKTGKFLYDLRKEKGLNQKELAKIIGVSDKTISKRECGEGVPSVECLMSLSDFYGVTINEIIKGEKEVKEIKEVNKTHELKTQFPIFLTISLVIGILGLIIYFIIMYACQNLAGSAIEIFVFTLLTGLLTFVESKTEKNNNFIAVNISNNLVVVFNLYLSLVSLGALLIGGNASYNIFINGVTMLFILLCAVPLLSLLLYCLLKNYRLHRSYKEMLIQNCRKYIDVSLVPIMIIAYIRFLFNQFGNANLISYYTFLCSFPIIIFLLILDFVLKKEIPFLIPSIVVVTLFFDLTLNTADLFLIETNGAGLIAIVGFIVYIITFVLKIKSKNDVDKVESVN